MRFSCRLLFASILQDASLGANFSLGKMATLDWWLIANVGTEERRDEVRAVVESLDDLRWLCDDMLFEHLNLYVEVMRDLIAKGLPGGLDACDAALYADEPTLMHKYTRGDGGVVYEYYAREDARSETVCGARCFVRERFTHVNITDVALEGTTESTRREAPGVAEREGPCAALCPGG